MNRLLFLSLAFSLLTISCNPKADTDAVKKDIFNTEKAFEKMCAEKGIAEAFAFYADENAVVLRAGDSLIKGKENIKQFYDSKNLKKASVQWTPDFIEVSEDGKLGYTYGKYTWKQIGEKGDTIKSSGVFHTVWKKQPDGSWKYVWD